MGVLGIYVLMGILGIVLYDLSLHITHDIFASMLTQLACYSRISRMENGECVIGLKTTALIPLLTFDVVVNIYLTTLFLIPLCSKSMVYTYTYTKINRYNSSLTST